MTDHLQPLQHHHLYKLMALCCVNNLIQTTSKEEVGHALSTIGLCNLTNQQI